MKNKSPKKNKEITLETIMEKMEDIFHSVNTKFSSIDLKLNEQDSQFQRVARRSDRMEVMLKKDIDNLAVAVARGFSATHTEIHDVEESLKNKIQGVERRIDDIADNKATREQLKSLDLRVVKIEKKIGV